MMLQKEFLPVYPALEADMADSVQIILPQPLSHFIAFYITSVRVKKS